jgi:hypothetical protein
VARHPTAYVKERGRMICFICKNEIKEGEFYISKIPKGYGRNKLKETEGFMHAIHLSSSDYFASRPVKR